MAPQNVKNRQQGAVWVQEDAVLCTDGHGYERCAIIVWLAIHDTSPVTGEWLSHR